jgi:hypothetical protein
MPGVNFAGQSSDTGVAAADADRPSGRRRAHSGKKKAPRSGRFHQDTIGGRLRAARETNA